MLKKFNNWYNGLIAFKKWIVSLTFNYFFWLIAWLVADEFFFEEKHSLKYHLFHAAWMAFIMTIPLKWKEIKQIFKPQKNKKTSFEDDKA
jgi:hypothetical protein